VNGILNKQLWIADKGRSSSLGVRHWLRSPHCEKPACYEMLHRASDLWALVNTVMKLWVP